MMIEHKAIKVLVELRPALDGHAGIPQETRLLFGALSTQEDIDLEGLLQTSFTFLPAGIDETTRSLSQHEKVNRFSRVVISLSEKAGKKKIINELVKYFQRRFSAAYWILINILKISGKKIKVTEFLPQGFEDFIWRRLFEKTLSAGDFDAVTKKRLRISSVPWGVMQMVGMWSSRLLGKASFPVFNLEHFNVFIAQTPFPGKVAGKTRLIVRYHDAVPMFLPHTIGHQEKHQANHYQGLLNNVLDGAYFACVSNATRYDLLRLFPELADRAVTIPNMASHHYYEEPAQQEFAMSIIRSRVNADDKTLLPAFGELDEQEEFYRKKLFDQPIRYLLMVSTLEPRKNHDALIDAWHNIHGQYDPQLKLILVGGKGWGSDKLIKRIKPWIDQGELFVLSNVPASELRVLYRNALATVCPSFAEGFDYSGIEAMQSAGLVVASEIPVHREVYSDAAFYFNPYDSNDLVNVLHRTLYSEEKESIASSLLMNGRLVSRCYSRETIIPKWQELLARVTASRSGT